VGLEVVAVAPPPGEGGVRGGSGEAPVVWAFGEAATFQWLRDPETYSARQQLVRDCRRRFNGAVLRRHGGVTAPNCENYCARAFVRRFTLWLF